MPSSPILLIASWNASVPRKRLKPRIGAVPTTGTVPLTNCNASGVCTAATSFNLAAGAYVIEARATFQVAN